MGISQGFVTFKLHSFKKRSRRRSGRRRKKKVGETGVKEGEEGGGGEVAVRNFSSMRPI